MHAQMSDPYILFLGHRVRYEGVCGRNHILFEDTIFTLK